MNNEKSGSTDMSHAGNPSAGAASTTVNVAENDIAVKKKSRRTSKSAIKRQKRKEAYIQRLTAMTPAERATFLTRIGGKIPRGMKVDFGMASTEEQHSQHAKKRMRKHKTQRDFHQKRRKRQTAEFKEIKYEIRGGLRFVLPYRHCYETFAKGRWTDRALHDVFTSEFGSNPASYYRDAIRLGLITVNGNCVGLDYNLRSGDLIRHIAHKHEPPVKGDPIDVVEVTDDIVVVNKPACMPVHACGAYIHNSVQHVLSRERPDLGLLNIVHRLDRLTSGLLVLARNPEAAARISKEIHDKEVQKWYVARVRGCLPSLENATALLAAKPFAAVVASNRMQPLSRSAASAGNEDRRREGSQSGAFILSCPLKCVDPKNSIHACAADGKPSSTEFEVVETNGESSVIRCRPVTGRTHQIRLHLQLLGCPIENDPNYGPLPDDAEGGVSAETLGGSLTQVAVDAAVPSSSVPFGKQARKSGGLQVGALSAAVAFPAASASSVAGSTRADADVIKSSSRGSVVPQSTDDASHDAELRNIVSICTFCQGGAVEAFTCTQLRHGGIWLHAYRYKGNGWDHSVPMPLWAKL
jgi:tRNA pseudouridine32 synthase